MARILIIEDDPVMLRMYTKVFGYEGFEVDIANDGMEGLKKAQATLPDLILLDIMMPVMSGMQVLDALKADSKTEPIPVMVFTNLAGKQDADTVLGKGAVQCIHKSQVNPKQVALMVKDELMKRGIEVKSPEQGGVPVQDPVSDTPVPASQTDQAVTAAPPQAAPVSQTPPAVEPAGVQQPVAGNTQVEDGVVKAE